MKFIVKHLTAFSKNLLDVLFELWDSKNVVRHEFVIITHLPFCVTLLNTQARIYTM